MRTRANDLHQVAKELRIRTRQPYRVVSDCTGEYKGTCKFRYCLAVGDKMMTPWTTTPSKLAAQIWGSICAQDRFAETGLHD